MPYICRNCANTGLDMLGNPCPCAAGRELTREAGKGSMVSDALTVHITADDMEPKLTDIVRRELASIHEEIAAVRDGLDAWAGRIQRLESLPGVAEAIAAQDEGE